MSPRHRYWKLPELEPQWTDSGRWRFNTGFSFDCPVHGTHRLIVRFTEPYDGEGAVDGPGLLVVMVSNGSFNEVTLQSVSGMPELDFGLCGLLRIIEGWVELALS